MRGAIPLLDHAVDVAIPESAVLVEMGAAYIGDADDVHPFPLLDALLFIAARPPASLAIEDIEACPIRPRAGLVVRLVAVHPEGPLLLPGRALAHPVDEVRPLLVRE